MLVGQTNRRAFIAALGSAAAWPLVARAQRRPAKTARIGIIDDAPIWDHFRRGLHGLGYIEGRDVTFEYRVAGGQPDRLAARQAISLTSQSTSLW